MLGSGDLVAMTGRAELLIYIPRIYVRPYVSTYICRFCARSLLYHLFCP